MHNPGLRKLSEKPFPRKDLQRIGQSTQRDNN